MPGIYQGTKFKNACRTWRYKEPDRGIVKMLDWDYREYEKRGDVVRDRHLTIAREDTGIEVVMSMDLWDHNAEECFRFTDELIKTTGARVLIPVHAYPPGVEEYDLAYPNANWFAKNVPIPVELRANIKHILGGSPHGQMKICLGRGFFKNFHGKVVNTGLPGVKSVDGNQIFNVAVRVGKYWQPSRPFWIKPRKKEDNQTIFARSVKNLDEAWKKW